jgi:hypothetical protein
MGTAAWNNWRAQRDDEPEREHAEDELHSDVQFIGSRLQFGPYTLSPVFRDHQRPDVSPSLLLHVRVHTSLTVDILEDGELLPTNATDYHGGILSDELAALISLELGVRLNVAGTRTLFIHRDTGEEVTANLEVPRLARPGKAGHEILPRVLTRDANLHDLRLLHRFPDLDEKSERALVRAARAYQSAIWWANQDPNQAWLQLVTALEIAAKNHQKTIWDAETVIRELDPELWALLQPLPAPQRAALAEHLAPTYRVAKTFHEFVVTHAPPPPSPRHSWDPLDFDRMRQHVQVIYRHRSHALHEGRPFPMPMLNPQPRTDPDGVPDEVPGGLNAGGLGGRWMAEDYPMTLSMFEHITRGALLAWWESLY